MMGKVDLSRYTGLDGYTPELHEEWLLCLRNGDYEQCREVLADGCGWFCCLGVLGTLAGASLENEACVEYLKTGVDGEEFVLLDEGVQEKLSKLNDSDGLTFPEIADWIEANLTPKAAG